MFSFEGGQRKRAEEKEEEAGEHGGRSELEPRRKPRDQDTQRNDIHFRVRLTGCKSLHALGEGVFVEFKERGRAPQPVGCVTWHKSEAVSASHL